ncbi:hypothetical protein Godav_017842 [Gossypium davidsonii]|uniref:Uncharacterized protein n=1 Tax=Gossypium davidsonii TaxID=34287 RepID=A0A7J8QVF4_GOSDV|nr:hypothetical protein [Gossypium davidsonii]
MVLCLLPVLPPELRPFAEERWPVFNPWLLLDIWDLIRWLWKGILLPQWDIVANLLARSGKDYEENTFWVEDGPEQIYRLIEEDRYYLYAE